MILGALRIPGLLTLLLLAAGIATKTSAILLTAIPLMVYMAVMLAFSVGGPPHRGSLHADRRLSQQRCVEGEEISVTTALWSTGPSLVVISDRLALDDIDGTLEGTTAAAFRLRRRDSHEQDLGGDGPPAANLHYTIRPNRGEFHLGGTRVTSFAPCPLTPRTVVLENPLTLRAVPRTSFVPPVQIRPRRTRVYAGSVNTHLGGSGLDFFGCRNYAPGDNTRAINWRIVARTGSLVVNEFEQERIADVSVILDCRASPYARSGERQLFDDSVRAAASFAVQFLRSGNRVGLLMYGDIPDWVYPGVGKLQEVQILDALSHAHTSNREAFRALRNLPTRFIPPGAQWVIISPLIAFDDAAVLSELRALGYELLLVSPFASGSTIACKSSSTTDAVAERTMRILRTSQMTAVRRLGVQVIEWDTTTSLAAAVAQLHHGRRRGTP